MICDAIRLEVRGGAALGPEQRAHAAACPQCREELREGDLLKAALRGGPSPGVTAAVAAEVRRALAAQPSPRPWWRSWSLGLALPFILGVIAGSLLQVRPDWGRLDLGWKWIALVPAGLTFLVGVTAAFRPGLRMGWAVPAALLGVGSAVALMIAPGATEGGGVHSGCLLAGLGISALPLAVLVGCLRREELSLRRGMLAGLGAGALGAMALFHHCPDARIEHLLPFHIGAWIVVCLLGAGMGEWLRKPIWSPR